MVSHDRETSEQYRNNSQDIIYVNGIMAQCFTGNNLSQLFCYAVILQLEISQGREVYTVP